MTTFAELKTAVALAIGDPSARTFSASVVGDLINTALAEIGRIAPERFYEEIDPIADYMRYPLRATEFPVGPVPEMEVVRVELWDTSITPARLYAHLQPLDGAFGVTSDSGWKVWDGVLEVPRAVPVFLAGNEADYTFRVWGYSPYPPLVVSDDVVLLSNEREQALILLCQLESIRRLSQSRDLYTQWQTHSGNTDVSPAGLMNALSMAQAEWRQRSRAIAVLREAPS